MAGRANVHEGGHGWALLRPKSRLHALEEKSSRRLRACASRRSGHGTKIVSVIRTLLAVHSGVYTLHNAPQARSRGDRMGSSLLMYPSWRHWRAMIPNLHLIIGAFLLPRQRK